MGWIVRIIGTLIAVLIVVVVLVGAVLFFLPAEHYARIAADQFEEATGRETLIEGDVRLAFWPELGFRTGTVTIANAEWSGSGPMFKAQGLSVGVDPLTLFGGDLRITRIEAVAPEILLETAKDGQSNWQIAAAGAGTGRAAAVFQDALPSDLALDEAVILDGRISIVDHATDDRLDLSGVNLNMSMPDLRGMAEFELSAEMNGQPFTAKGTVRDLAALIGNSAVPVSIDLSAGGSEIMLEGNAGFSPLTIDGRLDSDLSDLPAILALAGLETRDLPVIVGRDASLGGDVMLSDSGVFTLDNGRATLGNQDEGNRIDLTGVSLSLQLPDQDGKVNFELETSMNGQALAATGTIGDVTVLAGTDPVPLSLELATAGNRIAFEGNAGHSPLVVRGRLDADIADMTALLAFSGQEAPGLQQFIGDGALLSGEVTLNGSGELTLHEGRIAFGNQDEGNRIDLTGVNLGLRLPDQGGKVHFEIETSMNGQALAARGTIGDVTALAGTEPVPLSLELATAGNRIVLEGHASPGLPTVSGRLDADIRDAAALLALWGKAAPGLQQIVGSNALVSGEVALTDTGEFTLGGGRIAFGDPDRGKRMDLSGVDLSIRYPGPDDTADFNLEAEMNGHAFTANGAVRDVSALSGNRAVPVSLRVEAGDNRIRFEGDSRFAPLAATGRLNAEIADMASLLALAGRETPGILQVVGRDASLGGDLTLGESGEFGLSDGALRLGQNVVTGDLAFRPGKRPMLSAQIAGGVLDFSPLVIAAGLVSQVRSAPGGAEPGWPRTQIDVSWLQSFDARVTFSAESLDLGKIGLGPTRATITNDTGRAVVEFSELAAFGGSIAGSFVINSRGGLSARANLLGRNLDLQSLLTELAGYDRLTARGALEVNLLAIGNSVHELMGSLSGTVALSFGRGEYRGLDLVGALRDLDLGSLGEGRTTRFDSIDASFTVDGGVARNDDLVLQSPQLFVSGRGRFGIGSRTIDYRASASLLNESSETERTVPLIISGNWEDPKYELDVAEVLRHELLRKAPEIEDKAKEAVERKIEEELGSPIEGLDQVEEALKEQLKDQARERILDLLGGGN